MSEPKQLEEITLESSGTKRLSKHVSMKDGVMSVESYTVSILTGSNSRIGVEYPTLEEARKAYEELDA